MPPTLNKHRDMLNEQLVDVAREFNLSFDTQGEKFCTGWKDLSESRFLSVDRGFVCQIFLRITTPEDRSGEWYAYVNLPGMQVGQVPTGGEIYCGTERVYEPITLQEMMDMVRIGLAKLKVYVECLKLIHVDNTGEPVS